MTAFVPQDPNVDTVTRDGISETMTVFFWSRMACILCNSLGDGFLEILSFVITVRMDFTISSIVFAVTVFRDGIFQILSEI